MMSAFFVNTSEIETKLLKFTEKVKNIGSEYKNYVDPQTRSARDNPNR